MANGLDNNRILDDHDLLMRHDQKLSNICSTLQRIETKLDSISVNCGKQIKECLPKFEQRPTFDDLDKFNLNQKPTRREIYGVITIICAIISALAVLIH